MKTEKFIEKLEENNQLIFKSLDKVIRKHDQKVTVEVGSIMRAKEALVYKQENVFKYGLTISKNHFSFHSMVMYAFPDVLEKFKQELKGIKIHKGCINFKSIDALDLQKFEKLLKLSSQKDFSSVINHYKKK